MSIDTILPLLSRWAHILAAVTAVGGVFFLRFVLYPAASATLTDEQHAALRKAVVSRWKKVVMICIALLLLSGIYNLVRALKTREDLPGLYHALFGVKFLLALGVFFIASALVGRAKAFDGMRKKLPLWLGVVFVLGLVVILISGVLRGL